MVFRCFIAASTADRRYLRLRPNGSDGMLPSRACCSIHVTGTCRMSANCLESSRRSLGSVSGSVNGLSFAPSSSARRYVSSSRASVPTPGNGINTRCAIVLTTRLHRTARFLIRASVREGSPIRVRKDSRHLHRKRLQMAFQGDAGCMRRRETGELSGSQFGAGIRLSRTDGN